MNLTSMRCRTSARGVATRARKAATRVQLGKSDLQVSECCLGTMSWGEQNTEAEAHEQLDFAWDQGINFLDAAEMYPVPPKADTQGRTEQYIGTWLKGRKREDVVVASKVAGHSERIGWVRDAGAPVVVNKAQICEAVDKSLARLQTDCIDLYQIHWPERYVPSFGAFRYDPSQRREDAVPFEEQLEAMQSIIDQGKVRYIGVSNETSYGVMSFQQAAKAANLPHIHTIQNNYSLLVRSAWEQELHEVCLENDVSLLAYSPLAGGTLSGKYITGEESANSRLNIFEGYMERYNKSAAREATKEYMQIAEKAGVSPATLALAWCRLQPGVASTIIGATSLKQLKENITAFEQELSDETLDAIDTVHKSRKDPSTVE